MDDVPAAYRRRELPLAVRCRLAFLEGVADGAELTAEQLRRAMTRYPADPASGLAALLAAYADVRRLHEGPREPGS